MSRNYDNAPIGNTCPAIDKIIDKMEEAKNDAKWCMDNPDENSDDELTNIIWNLDYAISDMEQIRSDNSTLRDWGNEIYNEKDELERERDDLLLRIEELESELEEKI